MVPLLDPSLGVTLLFMAAIAGFFFAIGNAAARGLLDFMARRR